MDAVDLGVFRVLQEGRLLVITLGIVLEAVLEWKNVAEYGSMQ